MKTAAALVAASMTVLALSSVASAQTTGTAPAAPAAPFTAGASLAPLIRAPHPDLAHPNASVAPARPSSV